MERVRKPFQGVWNIVRFNWHFYLISFGICLLIILLNPYINEAYRIYAYIACLLIMGGISISLLVSFYVYDLSGLYDLNWLKISINETPCKIININAGFDETSILIADKFPDCELIVFDFYDPQNHSEVSIKRARAAYPPFPGTQRVSTSSLPLDNHYADRIIVTLSAHEIRKETERTDFFKELNRILKQTGEILVTEHLRNLPNFLAYNIGFFHFISKSSWRRTFKNAGLIVSNEIILTPFITVFTLK